MNLVFENDGALLQRSNYWTSQACQDGRMYLTWNAGVGRLLVPESVKDELFGEIKNAVNVEIEELDDRFCLYFDDGCEEDYLVQIDKGLSDRRGLEKGATRIDVYIEMGLKYQIKATIK